MAFQVNGEELKDAALKGIKLLDHDWLSRFGQRRCLLN